jgi:hypothetical protein
MPVIQRTEHPAEDIEEFVVAGLACDSGSVGVMLPFPIDIPQLEKWVPFVEGLPQDFKILFRVADAHGHADPDVKRRRVSFPDGISARTQSSGAHPGRRDMGDCPSRRC